MPYNFIPRANTEYICIDFSNPHSLLGWFDCWSSRRLLRGYVGARRLRTSGLSDQSYISDRCRSFYTASNESRRYHKYWIRPRFPARIMAWQLPFIHGVITLTLCIISNDMLLYVSNWNVWHVDDSGLFRLPATWWVPKRAVRCSSDSQATTMSLVLCTPYSVHCCIVVK